MKKITIGLALAFCGLFNANAQTAAWAHAIGGEDFDGVNSVKVDSQGNTYVAGAFRATAKFDPNSNNSTFTAPDMYGDVFLEKFDQNGNFLWVKIFASPYSFEDAMVQVNAQGDVYLVGQFTGQMDLDPGTGTDVRNSTGFLPNTFIVKLDSNGNYLFGRSFENSVNNMEAAANVFTLTAEGDLLFAGRMQSTVDFDPNGGNYQVVRTAETSFLTKFSANGDFVWVKMFDGNFPEVNITSLKTDSEGNIIAAGSYRNEVDFDLGTGVTELTTINSANADLFVLKLDADANFLWVRKAQELIDPANSNGFEENITSIEVDAEGDIYFAGTFRNGINFDPENSDFNIVSETPANYNIVYGKMTAEGDMVWVKGITGNYSAPWASAVAQTGHSYLLTLSDTGKLYFGMNFQGQVEIPFNDAAPVSYDSDSSIAVALTEINAENGNAEVATFLNSNFRVSLNAIDALGDYMYVTGSFITSLTFDADTSINIHGTTQDDAFVVKYSPVTLGTVDFRFNTPKVYPNPAKGNITIAKAGYDIQNITITDISGKIVKEQILANEDSRINLEGLSQGVYLLQMKGTNGTTVQKIIVE